VIRGAFICTERQNRAGSATGAVKGTEPERCADVFLIMTRPEIERRLRIVADEIGIAERWLVVAKGHAAEGWLARLVILEEEMRVLKGYLTEAEGSPPAHAPKSSPGRV